MNCPACPQYHSGHGSKDCLKCKKYKYFQIKHSPRPQISVEILPDAILESIADTAQVIDILQALKKIPLDYALTVLSRHVLDSTAEEGAKALKISLSNYNKKIKFSLNKIRDLILKS